MNKKTITFLIFLVFFVIYYAGSFSKISFGDCIGFVLDVEKREFSPDFMPLTHFLYLNTAIFFSKYLGMDSVFVMRMMSVLPAAMTVSLVFYLIKEFIEENWIAVMSTLVFGFSFTFWRSAETVEVYTFNALWIIAFLISAVKSMKEPQKKYLPLSGLILAFSFWVHIQNILLIPAYLVLLYFSKSEKRKVLISLSLFTIITSVMFIVNGFQNIEMKYVFFSKEGPWVEDTFSQNIGDLSKDLVKALAFLIYNFNIFILFSISGIFYFYNRYRIISIFLFTAGICTLGFATFYAVTDNYVFFIPFYIVFTLLIASGIKKLSSRYPIRKLSFIPFLIPLFYLSSLQVVSLIPQAQAFHKEKLYKGGLNYYMLPWLHDNIGCIEFTIEDGQTKDHIIVLKESSREFIKLRRRYQSMEEIRKL